MMKTKYLIGSIIIFVTLSITIFLLVENSVQAVSILDAKNSPKTVQVKGKKSNIFFDTSKIQLKFTLEDNENNSMDVIYKGKKPDNFEEATHVIVIGKYDHKSSIFYADSLGLKCPSKYVNENNQKGRD